MINLERGGPYSCALVICHPCHIHFFFVFDLAEIKIPGDCVTSSHKLINMTS